MDKKKEIIGFLQKRAQDLKENLKDVFTQYINLMD